MTPPVHLETGCDIGTDKFSTIVVVDERSRKIIRFICSILFLCNLVSIEILAVYGIYVNSFLVLKVVELYAHLFFQVWGPRDRDG